jgi:hypothetical protein
MLFMVIERFKPGSVPAIYQQLKDRGRTLPEGLTYQASWITADLGRCFQIMECTDAALLQEWVLSWGELVEMEIVPVVPSAVTQTVVQPHLN